MGRTFDDPSGKNGSKTMTMVITETDRIDELPRIAAKFRRIYDDATHPIRYLKKRK